MANDRKALEMTENGQPSTDDEETEDIPWASTEDFFVERGEDDQVLPVVHYVPSFGRLKIKPVTTGQRKDYFGEADNWNDAVDAMDDETKAKVLRRHIIKPDFSHVTAEDMQTDSLLFAESVLFNSIAAVSGLQGRAQVAEAAEDADTGN